MRIFLGFLSEHTKFGIFSQVGEIWLANIKTQKDLIILNLEIDFLEAVEGTKKTITFNRTDACPTCNGTKAKPGTSASTCGGCGGQGFQTIR